MLDVADFYPEPSPGEASRLARLLDKVTLVVDGLGEAIQLLDEGEPLRADNVLHSVQADLGAAFGLSLQYADGLGSVVVALATAISNRQDFLCREQLLALRNVGIASRKEPFMSLDAAAELVTKLDAVELETSFSELNAFADIREPDE